jgi:hypothetical protein
MEAWYRLMAEAVRAGGDASSKLPAPPTGAQGGDPSEWLATWMRENGLPGSPPSPEEMPDEWMEKWYRMMGVVPRKRYLKALERNDRLRRKLEEAEKRIERLGGAAAASQNQEKAAEEMLGYWKQSMEETLNAQRRWMQSLSQEQSKASSNKASSKSTSSAANSSGEDPGDTSAGDASSDD